MKRTTFLRVQLQEAGEDLESARGSKSWQAARDLRRIVMALYDELQSAEAQERENTTEGGVPVEATDEDVLGLIEAALDDLPDAMVDRLFETLLERRPEARDALDAAGVL